VSRDLPATQQRIPGSTEDLPVWMSGARRPCFTHWMLLAVSC